MVDHPGGFVWQHDTPCPLLAHEDGQRVADSERVWRAFRRPTTATELTLLAACGVDTAALTDPMTAVARLTPAVLRRTFVGVPDLDAPPDPEPEPTPTGATS